MKKIIIKGVSGLIGNNFINYLKSSYEIIPIKVRLMPNQQIDLAADVIIHLAGKAHDLKKVSNPSEYYESNFKLVKQLFDSFLSSEASVFIFMTP